MQNYSLAANRSIPAIRKTLPEFRFIRRPAPDDCATGNRNIRTKITLSVIWLRSCLKMVPAF